MEDIRISEKFISLQGEGLRTGVVSYFLRVCGCNLKCPGFGLPSGTENTEIPMIIKNIDKYDRYDSLPLSKTGCDSYPSSWPQFKKFSPEMTPQAIIDDMVNICNDDLEHVDLVLTGGEPLLKPMQRKLGALFNFSRQITLSRYLHSKT